MILYRAHREIRSLLKCGPGAAWGCLHAASLENLIRLGVRPLELQDEVFREWKRLLEAGEL